MSDKPIENSRDDRMKGEINYRARSIGASGLIECLVKDASCHWRIPFTEGWLCAHMFNKRIAMGLRVEGCSLAGTDEGEALKRKRS